MFSNLKIGTVPSYIDTIKMHVLEDNMRKEFQIVQLPGDSLMNSINPDTGVAIEPGRKSVYNYELSFISELFIKNKNIFPVEIIVYDEIGNAYRSEINNEMRHTLIEYAVKKCCRA